MSYTPAAFRSGQKVAYRIVGTAFLIVLFILFFITTNYIMSGKLLLAIYALWLFWVVLLVIVLILWGMWYTYKKWGQR